MNSSKKKALTLLKTARGQIDATINMIEEERYCIDISNQILASKGLLEKANLQMLEQHLKNCLKNDILEGNGDEKIEEILSVLSKYLK